MPDQTAETTAYFILNEVISRLGCPLDIHSDQGRNYESHIFKELCTMLEVRKTTTTAQNPKCNGKVERFNKTLVRMIRSNLKEQQSEWDKYFGCLAAAYRSSVHEKTGFTPNMLMLGSEVKMPSDVMFSDVSDSQEPESFGSYVESIRNKMRKAHKVAQEHLKVKAKRQKDNYDAKSSFNHYCVGDYVWYLTERRQIGENPKLYMPYKGPYVIVDKLSDIDFVIQACPTDKYKVINRNKLKPNHGTVKYNWVKSAIKKPKYRNKHFTPNNFSDSDGEEDEQ